jgi:CheY-like chemotaxis protein
MKRLRIMVVEDDAMIAFLLGEILSGMGHDVCALEGTQEGAIAAALRCKPDLMIVDEHLGDGSGLKVVDSVLGNRPIPHVFVSGDVRTIQRMRPHDVIVEKPYSEADLARAIQRALNLGIEPAPRRPSLQTQAERHTAQRGHDNDRLTGEEIRLRSLD